MALRVILNNNSLRLVDNTESDISDIRFYIPMEIMNCDYFVKLDSLIFPLTRTSEMSGSYYIYSIGNTLYGKSATELSLIGISTKNVQDSFCTDKCAINVKSSKLDNINSVYYSLRMNTDVEDMYKKIVKMTELNIKINNEFSERFGDING